MSPIAEVGSVFVSVVPSMRGFKAKMNAELKTLGDVEMGVNLDAGKAKAQAAAARKTMGGDVKFNADLDTGAATAKLTAFKSVLGSIAMPAGIVAATPYLLSLGSSAVQAAGALALIPAAAVAGGLAFGALKVATSGVGDAVKYAFDPTKVKQFNEAMAGLAPQARSSVFAIQGLKGQLDAVKMSAQGALFSGMAPLITSLGNTYLPMAAVTFGNIAGSANAAGLAFGRWLTTAPAIALVRGLADGAAAAFRNIAAAFAPLGQAFLGIAAIGMPILVGLTAGAGGVATEFRNWVFSASGILTIRGWITGAILVLGQLWQIALNVGSIMGSLFAGGAASGQSFLSILVQVTTWLANALRTPESAAILSGTLAGIRDIVGLLWQKFVILWPAISALGGAFFALLQAASPITLLLANILSPVLTLIGIGLQALAPILGPLIGLWMLWNGVMAITNIIMSANPIMLVVGAIALLVGAVIYAYTHFTWFKAAVDAVGAAFVWFWQAAIVPAWNAIVTAFTWAWGVIQPILSFIGTALAYLGIAIGVLLVAPFVIGWHVISAIFQWAWGSVISPIFGFIGVGLTVLGAAFSWFNSAVIQPVWRAITAAIGAAWNWINGNVFQPIANVLRGVLGPVFEWLYNNVIRPVWSGISAAIAGAWNFIQGVFEGGKRAVNAVGQAFQSVADWIGRAWATIREATRAPVQFVVDVVYNNGIRPVWNGIAGLFGMAQLGPVHLAQGGVLPGYTPGRDVYPAMLSGGEGILVPEAVRGLGPAFVGWANRTFSGGRSKGGVGTPQGGGFSKGGVAHFADGGILGGIGDLAGGAMDFMMKLFTGSPGDAVKELFAGVMGDGARTPGRGPWTDALKAIPGKVVEAVIGKAKAFIDSMMSFGGGIGGAGVQRWSGVALKALAMAGQPASYLPLLLMQMNSESGGNPGIFNNWDINARNGVPSGGLMQVIGPTFAAYAGPLRGLGLLNPLANIYAAIKYTVARYGSLAAGWHGHGYAKGGVVPGAGSSDSVRAMLTPGERVLTRSQTASFDALVATMSRRPENLGPGLAAAGVAAPGGGASLVVNQQLPDGASARQFANELSFELRRNGLAQGVHAR